jgi:hypothetical protein
VRLKTILSILLQRNCPSCPYKSRSFRNYIIINSFKLDCVRSCCYCYNVYKFSTTTQNGIVINEPGYLGTTTSTTYPVTGLTSSTEYSFTVKAKDEAGNLSEATNEVTVTTKF